MNWDSLEEMEREDETNVSSREVLAVDTDLRFPVGEYCALRTASNKKDV